MQNRKIVEVEQVEIRNRKRSHMKVCTRMWEGSANLTSKNNPLKLSYSLGRENKIKQHIQNG
jgi:hypothetical protein